MTPDQFDQLSDDISHAVLSAIAEVIPDDPDLSSISYAIFEGMGNALAKLLSFAPEEERKDLYDKICRFLADDIAILELDLKEVA